MKLLLFFLTFVIFAQSKFTGDFYTQNYTFIENPAANFYKNDFELKNSNHVEFIGTGRLSINHKINPFSKKYNFWINYNHRRRNTAEQIKDQRNRKKSLWYSYDLCKVRKC